MEKLQEQTMIDTSTVALTQMTLEELEEYKNFELENNVRKILEEDFDLDEHVTSLHVIANFNKYAPIIKKFGVTPEEFFETLSLKNKRLENFEFLKKPLKSTQVS